MKRRIHGVEDILLGFGPKDAGSIPAGSVSFLVFALVIIRIKKIPACRDYIRSIEESECDAGNPVRATHYSQKN